MKVDIQALGEFNQMAQEGAEQASRSMETLAGIRPAVDATSVDLLSVEDVGADFRETPFVAVCFEFEDAMSGGAILVFEEASAEAFVESFPGGAPDSKQTVMSRIESLGNIVVSSFVDRWAYHLNDTIELTPPRSVTGTGIEALQEQTQLSDRTEQVLSVTSHFETDSKWVDTATYILPDRESLAAVLGGRDGEGTLPIPLSKLQTFNRMTARGTEQAAENIRMMTGTETAVSVSQMRFIPIEKTAETLREEPYVGVVVSLEGAPSGYLLLLFTEASARRIAEALGATAEDSSNFGEAHRSAIKEIGNIMCSGFIDGWANVLGTSIEHTPPEFVHDFAAAIVDPVAANLAREQRYVFMFDSVIETAEEATACEILALPEEKQLLSALQNIDIEASTDDQALQSAMEAEPEDVF